MGDGTSIEWTDATWNPTRGCSRVSEGCRNCYAERVAARFSGRGQPYAGFARTVLARDGSTLRADVYEPRWTGRVELIPSQLDLPLRWRKPRRVFVDSMSDLFHEKLADEDIAAVFGVMALAERHTFQVLTKRAGRMAEWMNDPRARVSVIKPLRKDGSVLPGADWLAVDILSGFPWPLPNVWLGVSVEDQATADERIPHLLATPAAIRFVSYEPALGPVDFATWLPRWREQADPGACACGHGHGFTRCPNTGGIAIGCSRCDCPGFCRRPGQAGILDWVIVGGESGPGARPMDLAWARSVVAQSRAAGAACFVKQLGARPYETVVGEWPSEPTEPGRRAVKLRDRKGGDMTEWSEDLRVREWPTVETRVRVRREAERLGAPDTVCRRAP